ncbi:MAG: NUDIX domain-containing protein [Bacillaceae bacterium]
MNNKQFQFILNEYEQKKIQLEKQERESVATYDSSKFKTPDGYTADVALFTIGKNENDQSVLKLLLIQRSEFNAEGKTNSQPLKWALPGGFISSTETANDAAVRELKEETSLENIHVKHFGVYDKPGRDKRGWIITNAFYAIVPPNLLEQRSANDDAYRVELFDLNQVFQLPLAFDHEHIIHDAIKMIKRDLLQTTVASNFLPTHFTLSELRDVLLTVCEDAKVIEKAAFYRKIPTLPFITLVKDEQGRTLTTTRNSKRPSKLYQFTKNGPNWSIYY